MMINVTDLDAIDDRRIDRDASDLGLAPGVFPETISIVRQGSNWSYRRHTARYSDDGDLIAVNYVTDSSIGPLLMVVWND